MTDNDNKTQAQRAEENAVRQLGDAIGYGRIMRLAQQLWRDALIGAGHPPGGEFSVGPCAGSLVPCACIDDQARDDEPREGADHCDWCCGAKRVTARVRAAMDEARAAPGWRIAPPSADEVREHPWWWNRSPNGTRHVLHLDVNLGSDVIIDVEEAAAHDCGGRFDPDAWPGEWAPCLPPGEGGPTP